MCIDVQCSPRLDFTDFFRGCRCGVKMLLEPEERKILGGKSKSLMMQLH